MRDYIKRTIEPLIEEALFKNKVIVIYGPRQSGKTTLARKILENRPQGKYLLCERPEVSEVLESNSVEKIISFFEGSKLIILDEAQTVKNIGRILKLLVDTHPEIQIIATGSSSFELSNEIVEPLTGRKYEFKLLPLSLSEICLAKDKFTVISELENYLIFGQYPGVYISNGARNELLIQEIAESYLFKDILAFQDIRNSEVLIKLLQMLALQIGCEVSFTELANSLGIDKATVQRYIDLLEKIFIIHRLTPFSRNLRNELNKKRKIYFYDLGIRNAVIRNFNSVDLRNDTGNLWENFCVNERLKYLNNNQILSNRYFWRTWEGSEIDYVEEGNGRLDAYEFKWGKSKKVKAPKAWTDTYTGSSFGLVNKDNILQFVGIS